MSNLTLLNATRITLSFLIAPRRLNIASASDAKVSRVIRTGPEAGTPRAPPPSLSLSELLASSAQSRDSLDVSSSSDEVSSESALNSSSEAVTAFDSSLTTVNMTAQEEYYSDYDPMMGIRIATSLLIFITVFALFLIYKSHCNARKAKRILHVGRKDSSRRSSSKKRTDHRESSRKSARAAMYKNHQEHVEFVERTLSLSQ